MPDRPQLALGSAGLGVALLVAATIGNMSAGPAGLEVLGLVLFEAAIITKIVTHHREP